MRLAAFVGMKDEVELIGDCIRQLKAIGADVVTVLDDASTDGSRELVERLAATDPTVRLSAASIDLSREGPVFRPVLKEFAPDWLLFTDADEFWLPRGGDLKRIPDIEAADVLIVERFNVPLTDPPFDINGCITGNQLCQIPLILKRELLNRKIMEADHAKRWVMHAVGPKIMCRARVFDGFALGAHRIVPRADQQVREVGSQDVIIAHVPFSSYARFARKVDNARRVFERFDEAHGGEAAWHWRRWVSLADQGLLPAEFEAQRMSAMEMSTLKLAGTIGTAGSFLAEAKGQSGGSRITAV